MTTSFLYGGDAVLLERQGGATYGNALVRKDGETPLFDGLGSERTVTNTSGAVQATLTLSAFGQAVASSGSTASAYQYAATSRYRSDGDAGLSLVGARYYDAQTGSFISRDTFLDQKPYAYCDGDPVNATDPSGHINWGKVGIDIAIGLCVVAALAIIPEAAPVGLQIIIGMGIGATGGATTAASDYNQDNPDSATWDNGTLANKVGEGAIIGTAVGAVGGPALASGTVKVLQEPAETLEDGGGI